MRISMSIIALTLGIILATPVFATSLNLYEKPDINSKIVTSVANTTPLIQIFKSDDKKDWVKVANQQNGEVGWAKVSELKGPIIFTEVDNSKVQQQIIVNKKDGKEKESVTYSMIQYSGPNQLKPEEAEKKFKEMQKYSEEIRNNTQKMFKDFDKEFATFPVIQPIIIVHDKQEKKVSK